MKTVFKVGLYLASIVTANLLVTIYGPSVAVLNAFLFIGLDITIRDSLHEKWHNNRFKIKMFLLIFAGSALSYVLNKDAQQIATASCAAFLLSAFADTLVYSKLFKQSKLTKINTSNVISAAVDSFTFPALAFGFPLLVPIMIGQFIAKTLGGFLWSLVI